MLVAQIDGGQLGILLPPFGDVLFVALIALEEVIFAQVRQNVGSLFRHQNARIFRIGEVDLRNLLGVVLAVDVKFAHHPRIHRHARLPRRRLVARINAGENRKRIVMRCHGGGTHVEKNSVGVDQANLLAVAREGDRRALNNLHTNLVGQQAHHGRVFNPRNRFKLFAALADGHEEDVAANVFAEDRQHLRSTHFSEPGGLDVIGSGDAEAGIALEVSLGQINRGRDGNDHDQRAERKKHATYGALRPPPAAVACIGTSPFGARKIVAVWIIHLERHAGQCAPRSGYTLLHAPVAGSRRHIILPNQRPGCGVTLIRHA